LTVGTGNPAYPPWWEGGETDEHSDWQINDPHLLEGFEGAVVGAVAEQLGFTTDQIEFIPVPFGKSYVRITAGHSGPHPGIVMADQNGNTRLFVGLDESGEPQILLMSDKGTRQIRVE